MTLRLRILAVLLALASPTAALAQFAQQGNKLVGAGAVSVSASPVLQGQSVALSSDGSTAIVGGNNDSPLTPNGWAGAAWIYTRSGGAWTQQGPKLVGTGAQGGAQQGTSVDLSADGNTAIVGGPFDGFTGAAWIFTRSGGAWTQQGNKLLGTGAQGNALQGTSVALSSDGNTALIGGPADSGGVGAIWIFTRSNGLWTQQGAKLVGGNPSGTSDQGVSVALSADGNTALVGGDLDAASAGAAWVFTRNTSTGIWTQQGPKLTGLGIAGVIAYQGHSVSLSSDGNTAAIGGYFDGGGVGATWVFTRNTSTGVWTQQGLKLVGSGGLFPEQGRSVTLSGDGNTLVAGGPVDSGSVGAAWVFRRSAGTWIQQGNRVTGTGEVGLGDFGWSVHLSNDGSTLLVGGTNDNQGAGAAWPFGQAHFGFSAPSAAAAGVPFNFTVSALDANNAAIANYAGTVHFTSSDPSAVLPADTVLASGTGSFTATLKTNGSQTITATDTVNSAITGNSAIVVSNGAAGLTPVSVSPAGGSGFSSSFTFTFSDPKGYTDLGVVNVLVNNVLDGRHACYLAYNQPTNVLYLVGDDGSTLSPGSVLSTTGSASNSQCTVNWGGTPVSGSGANLTLTLTISFTSAFAGNKVVYLAARDQGSGNSGWQPLGVWQVPATSSTTTQVVGAVPNRGSGLGPAQFTFTFSDTKGYTDIGVSNILINSSLDGRHACFLAYSRPLNVLYLMNDNGDTLLAGVSLASSGTTANSQCTVTWGPSPVTAGGTNLALTLNIAFNASFDGNRIIYLATRDVNEANNTGWQTMGTWTVQ